jgi:hypothetical protein
VPPDAKACPECGSCEATGWSEKAASDALDLPDQEFDYDEFVREEFGERKVGQRRHSWWWLVVVILVIFVLIGLLR